MTFFLDANVLLYAAVECEQRDACAEILRAVATGAEGRTSVAVLEEVWHIERSGRLGRLDGVAERAHRLLTPLLPVDDEAFARALTVDAPQLGANDRRHVGTCLVPGIDRIVTADRGFDGVRGVRRVDPLDAPARRRLVRTR
ncbi:MAG TPA: type II toxin-antitoxin system VapC family toxin [Conexibacter sp.]